MKSKNSLLKFPILALGLVMVLATSCKKDEETAPKVSTLDATEITYNSAIIGGDITSDGGSDLTIRGLVWGTSPNPTLSDNVIEDSLLTTGAFTYKLTGLSDETTYYVRAYATNGIGTTFADEKSFTTAEKPYQLLSKIDVTWYETYGTDTYEETEVMYFDYDQNDRLIEWRFDDGYRYEFFYDADGRLELVKDIWQGYEDHLVFTWEGNQVTSQWYWDGVQPGYSKRIMQLNSNGEIELIEYYYNWDKSWTKEFYDELTWQNGNVVKIDEYYSDYWKNSIERDKRFHRKDMLKGMLAKKGKDKNTEIPNIAKNSDYNLEYTLTFTYDDKLNPFSMHHGMWLFEPDWLFLPKNNATRMVELDHWDGEEWVMYIDYLYNDADYPSRLNVEFEEDPYTFGVIWEFSYQDK